MDIISRRGFLQHGVGAAALAGLQPVDASDPRRSDVLRYVTPGVVNTLDPVMLGATPEATALGTCTYDRLLRFGRSPTPDGASVFDFDTLEGELAERHEVSPDGRTITVHVRQGMSWHDGAPVTAEDVKWSLDRAVSADSMAKAQLASGSLLSPEQFSTVGPLSVRIRLDRPDRLALPNLATNYAPMFNSRLANLHATDDDPWATRWLRENTAGGGAFLVQERSPTGLVTLVRNEGWGSGRPAPFRRVFMQTVPEAATRSMLVARGDADLAIALSAQDLRALQSIADVNVVSTPMSTGFAGLIFNTALPPFDDVNVRRALAAAIPYDAVFEAVVFGRGEKLYGAGWKDQPSGPGFPQALPLHTDLDLAKRSLAASAVPNGFTTTIAYGATRAAFAEPAAALIQEALARIGVVVRIEKLPDSQMAQAITDKRLPMMIERSFALFPSTEYFFRIFASGPSRWNFASWRNPDVEALLPQARYEVDEAKYRAMARRLIGIMADQVPLAMIWQPTTDVALARSVKGLSTLYNYYPDLRALSRS